MNDLFVRDVMTLNPVSVSLETAATRVRSILRDEDFRCVPVVEGEKLRGLITRGDVLNITATKSNLEARGIMEKPKVILTPEMDVMRAASDLLKAGEIQAPVVESTDSMKLVGILSVIDLISGFLENGYEPVRSPVSEIMSPEPVTCEHSDQLSAVWDLMDESGFSGLPVMKNGKMIGIITRKDLLRYGHARIHRESGEVKSVAVEKIMKTPPVAITPDTPSEKAASLMLEKDIGRIPVVENPVFVKRDPSMVKEADLLGIVSREDVLEAYIK
ncbi:MULTISPECIES: CBS domain-containing protein [Methanothermobacter]|uniref:CBS domain-containing protein n=1 Tax=Methanothermobacter TaxID=145260 RepID=UPI00191BEAED|nr:CBS domain-containing protein [Methanothermobacter sp. THM-2]